jgi:hypothetical protein
VLVVTQRYWRYAPPATQGDWRCVPLVSLVTWRYSPPVTTTTDRCSKCNRTFDEHLTCAQCGRPNPQPYDPGSYREYCSNACRQRAYRARGGRASGTRYESAGSRARREQEEAWAREEERKERERQRSYRRRYGFDEPAPEGMPGWCTSRPPTDTPQQRRARERAYKLFTRAMHKGTGKDEAETCRLMAEKIRAKHGL